MSKTIWGLDLGSNSLGWAVFNSNQKLKPIELIDLGVRIFPKAVEDKTPTPKISNGVTLVLRVELFNVVLEESDD